VYEFRIRYEDKPLTEVTKCGVCLQDDLLSKDWDCVTFARTHSFKDNTQPKLYQWDVWVDPTSSHSKFGIKVICKEIYTIKKMKVDKLLYELPETKVREINGKLLWSIGMPIK